MAATAQVVPAPIVVVLTGTFSEVGIVANLLVASGVAMISVVGTLAALVGAIGSPTGQGLVAELLVRALAPELCWMGAGASTWVG